ncbi:hypothetical protein [Streptomyces qinzhouensis]|uniref:Replication activator protein Pra n=1 Tax=Streptomyces qinzhouensis TaxID=2599401 RepID=A0A5B8J9N0_9ACTN|nr:hypothetical protein [Streptomyces qinzhouensis]QDY78097.1 hypothetical protein FQU76_18140 [Streptomyces qinzhouensis]
MRSMRTESPVAKLLLAEAPAPKVRDWRTGEIARDVVSGEVLMSVGVVYIEDGQPSLVRVVVPESGVVAGLIPGSPVALPGLVARAWEGTFNGRQHHGIVFRAAAVTPAAPGASV